VAIRAGKSVDELLEVVAATAASIIGADHVLAETVVESSPVLGERSGERRVRHVVRLPRDSPLAELSLGRIAGGSGRVVRLTASELARRPEWRSATSAVRSTPLRGFLAAPIIAAEGRITGSIQLAGKRDGEFTSDDEALLEPLARIASIAIENALYSEAQEASRAKDEFLATLSHELRTPLQAMLSWTRLLREEGVDPQMLARGLEVIERSATAQKELIDDLLDVSRMMAQNFRLDLERVSLSKVLGHAVEAARPAAEAKGIDLRPALESRPLIVRGDPQRLQQIFGNLLTNAIKFTPSGGTVEIDLARMDGRARIRVRDTGEGIPGEFIPHLFERFRQADSSSTRAHGGLGIGLAIVRHLVELHAGTVTAESAGVDQGACFTVTLPLAEGLELEEDSAAAEASEEAVVAGRLDGLRLLLLEDEEHTREALALTLRQRGAEVTAVATAADAIAALDRELPDVLISDVAMPGEDGISFIRRLRERSAQRGGSIPATALSAYARPEESARALRAGFDLHLSKPVADDLLVASVRRLAARAGR